MALVARWFLNAGSIGRIRFRPWPSARPSRAASWTIVLIGGLGLFISSCGSGASTSGKPSLTASPNTGLVGGQTMTVSLSTFPKQATVMVEECAHVPTARNGNNCGNAGSTILYTGTTGRATGKLVAWPSPFQFSNGTTITCRDQCVVVAIIIKEGKAVAPKEPVATAALSFSETASNLAYSFLQDLTWISPTEGWALASQPCSPGVCARLAHTTDGGSHWQALPDPPMKYPAGIAFATPTVGYLFGPSLLLTTDGGRSWRVESGPPAVEALAVAGGAVYRVAYQYPGCPGPCQPTLQEAPVGSDTWQTLVSVLTTPERGSGAQIVDSDSTFLVAMYGSQAGPVSAQAIIYRSTDGGGSWQQMSDPCSDRGPAGVEEDLVDLAGASGGFFAGLCRPHAGNGNFIVTSTDGGSSWTTVGSLPAVQALGQLAAASPSTLAVATAATYGAGPDTAELLVSTDMGLHWATAASDPQQFTQLGVPAWLGFETSQVGRWIGDPHSVWTTQDGGKHWVQLPFH